MAEEREFEVIDKRRARTDGEPSPEAGNYDENAASGPATPGITAEDIMAAAEEAAAGEEDDAGAEVPHLDVAGALTVCVNMLNEVAWMKMGLIANPMSGKIERDLVQAKVAIDAVGDLVPRLEPLIGASERRDLQVMLSNLRINFVQQSQKG